MNTKIQLSSEDKKELRQYYGWWKDETDLAKKKNARLEAEAKFPAITGHWSELPELIYSANQLKFIEDAEESGNGDLHFQYSGRGMYGDCCPALYCDSHNDITTKARTQIDSMGKGIVIYAQY